MTADNKPVVKPLALPPLAGVKVDPGVVRVLQEMYRAIEEQNRLLRDLVTKVYP